MDHANNKYTGHFHRLQLLVFSVLLFSGAIQAKAPQCDLPRRTTTRPADGTFHHDATGGQP